MLQEINAVIFDLDGTLIDSMWMWKEIDIEYLDRFGIPLPPGLQDDIEGMSFTETAGYFKEVIGIPLPLEEIKADWIRMAMDKYESQVPPKDGAFRFLKYLKEHNIRTGIATSNSMDLVDAAMKGNRMGEFFDVILTGCSVARGKPAPDIYLKVADELKVETKSCLVFEDVPKGILAGKNAGMRVCAVEDEFSAHLRTQKKQLADYYIRTYDDIFDQTYEVLTHHNTNEVLTHDQ
ncbi:HAD family hydrolase [Diplocloster agilis]|uniref:HAD family hydrolase n=1 Tax=Diplocloster agilis TaxID=2850323 RepID=UPI0008214B22|nr:HAD family phosphatase [Suonthocola fibrivorans]MCU6733177.1 HAD family phosphatase [Suonthocola fibrivorans]SCI80139.1 Phosphorylated carbohydrates phosphatase TM_1254 [uncultured Clostridium sp.]